MACIRLILRWLLVVTVALGLASAPLYAVAQVADAPTVAQPHHGPMTQIGKGSSDHDDASPAKHHAMGQTCCHPGCIMAVVPSFATLATAHLPWVVVAIPRDSWGPPPAPLGIDRPPKYA